MVGFSRISQSRPFFGGPRQNFKHSVLSSQQLPDSQFQSIRKRLLTLLQHSRLLQFRRLRPPHQRSQLALQQVLQSRYTRRKRMAPATQQRRQQLRRKSMQHGHEPNS
jgi:hypothetical protein